MQPFTTSSTTVNEQPNLICFLGIDNVLYKKEENFHKITTKVKELFPKKESFSPWDKETQTTKSLFFNEKAIENLNLFLKEIQKVAKLQIVITSNIRLCAKTVSEMKDFFSIHEFSEYIIGGTGFASLNPENHCTHDDHKHEIIKKAYCRASEIQEWISKNKTIYYVVLDSVDKEHLAHMFAKRSINIDPNKLLTLKNVKKALAVTKQILS